LPGDGRANIALLPRDGARGRVMPGQGGELTRDRSPARRSRIARMAPDVNSCGGFPILVRCPTLPKGIPVSFHKRKWNSGNGSSRKTREKIGPGWTPNESARHADSGASSFMQADATSDDPPGAISTFCSVLAPRQVSEIGRSFRIGKSRARKGPAYRWPPWTSRQARRR